MKTLIVFYSRKGRTRAAAAALATELGADLEEIRERRARKGFLGFIRSGFEASTRRIVPILPLTKRLADYERVIIGTPVWAGSISSPVRSFLVAHAEELPEVGYLLTHGDRKNPYVRVMDEMDALVGKGRAFERSIADI